LAKLCGDKQASTISGNVDAINRHDKTFDTSAIVGEGQVESNRHNDENEAQM
jgi:hypothetical protein